MGLELYEGDDGEEGRDVSQEGFFISEARESLKEACTVVVQDAINAVLLGLRESVSLPGGSLCCLGYFTSCRVCVCVRIFFPSILGAILHLAVRICGGAPAGGLVTQEEGHQHRSFLLPLIGCGACLP